MKIRHRLLTFGICWFILIIILCFPLTSAWFYNEYSLKRSSDLNRIVLSLENMKPSEPVIEKEFRPLNFSKKLEKYIRSYLGLNTTRYLIISCETGLGNRIQSIVSAFVMAMLMKRRLVIHWPETTLSSCAYNQLFQSQSSVSWNLSTSYTRTHILENSDLLHFHGPFDELLCHPNMIEFKQEIQFLFVATDEYFMSVLMKNPHYSHTLFDGIDEDNLFRTLVEYLFIPITILNEKISQYISEIKQCDRGLQMRKEGLRQILKGGEDIFLSNYEA